MINLQHATFGEGAIFIFFLFSLQKYLFNMYPYFTADLNYICMIAHRACFLFRCNKVTKTQGLA